MTDDHRLVCINCLQPADSLYRKYSPEVIRLTECKNCKGVVDKYVEYDVMLIVVDLIIHYSCAYRHIIYNMPGKNFLRLLVLFIFCDAYDKWISERSTSIEANKIYDLELIFYKSLARSAAEFLAFLTTVAVFDIIKRKSISRLSFVVESTVLGYYGNVAVVLSIIFRLSNEPFYRLATQLFLFISHTQIQRALFPDVSLIVNVFVVVVASIASHLTGETIHNAFT